MSVTNYILSLTLVDEDPSKNVIKTVEIPAASLQDQALGWTFGYKFLSDLTEKVEKDTGASIEAVESTILRLFDMEPRVAEEPEEGNDD